jgi:hypothetical protein
MTDIVSLPDNFIGKDDEQRLESFGAHLIAHGFATRWHWTRERGIDVAFEILKGGAHERLLVYFERDRERDAFRAKDGGGTLVAEGTLDHVMAVVDRYARASSEDLPA